MLLARGPDVAKARSLTELSGVRVSVETTLSRRDPCGASAANTSATRSGTVATHPGVLTSQGSAPPHSNSLSAANAEETTQPNTWVVQSGKKPRRCLLGGRRSNAIRCVVHLALPPSRQNGRSRPQSR